MSSFETILLERADEIATLTINHPDRANVLSQATMREISQALEEVAADNTIRSAILTGAGERVFVGGADIGELRELTAVSARASIPEPLSRLKPGGSGRDHRPLCAALVTWTTLQRSQVRLATLRAADPRLARIDPWRPTKGGRQTPATRRVGWIWPARTPAARVGSHPGQASRA